MNENTATIDHDIATKETNLFSIDEALDSKGFALYLQRHPELESIQIDDSNAGQIEQLFTTFQSLERIRPDVIKTLSSNILRDTTVRLESEGQEKIAIGLEQMAIDDPESINRWAERIQTKITVEQAQKDLVASQKESRELRPYDNEENELFVHEAASSADRLKVSLKFALQKKLDLPILGRFILPDEVRAGQKDAVTLFGMDWRKKLNDIQEHIDKTRQQVAETRTKIGRAEELKTELSEKSRQYWDMRRDIDNLMDLTGGLRESFLIKVQEKIDYMLDAATSIKDLENANAVLETVNKGADISTLETLGYNDIDRVKVFIDKKFEEMATGLIREKIASYEIPGSSAISKLEQQLKEVIDAKAVGGRSEKDMRDFICETIETVADNKETPPIKKLLLTRLLIRLKR